MPSSATPATLSVLLSRDGHELYETAPGIVGQLCGYINRTAIKPQPALVLGNVLAFWGAVVGRKVATSTDMRTNLYVIGVGKSGCGKDHSRGQIKRICHAAGVTDEVLGGEDFASDSGLLSALSRQPSLLFQLDEIGHLFSAVTSRTAMAHHRKIAPTLTRLFSSAHTEFRGKEYANGKLNPLQKIIQPNACIYGTTVPDRLFQALTLDEIRDGFLPRMLVFTSDARNPPRNADANPMAPVPAHIVAELQRWHARPSAPIEGNIENVVNNKPIVVPFDRDAKLQFDRFAVKCDRLSDDATSESGCDALWARAFEHAGKVALTVSACGEADPVIGGDAAAWAIALVDHLVHRLVSAADEHVSGTPMEANTKKMLAIIRKAGTRGIVRSDLTRKSQWADCRLRAQLLQGLIEAGQIHQQSVGAALRYFYVDAPNP